MTFEQFAVAVHDWQSRLTPAQVRAEIARQLASQEGVEGLRRGISIEAVLVMLSLGLGPGMRPIGVRARSENGDLESELAPAPAAKPADVEAVPDSRVEVMPAPEPSKPSSLRGRPSHRAQALVREQLANGPKRGEEVRAAAYLAEISEGSLIAAADSLGVRTRKGQWWLPGRKGYTADTYASE